MKSKRRAGKSLSSERKKRLAQSKKLQNRVKLGQDRSQGKRKGILKDDISTNNWYPKDGTHIVDVIPYTAGKYETIVNKGDPTYTFECWVHTRVGTNKIMLLCMAEMYGGPCPICEERQKLHNYWGGRIRNNKFHRCCTEKHGKANKSKLCGYV